MHLCPVAASSNHGHAAYGTAEVSVQGAVPALLAGQVAGALFGPSWLASDGSDILYQNGGTGYGPWILQTYDVDTPALTTEDADGQNFLAAGGGVWAAYLAGSGVRSNVVIASPTAPLSGAGVLDVSADGNIVLVDYVASAVGITVYDSSGASIYSQPTTQLTNPIVRLVGNILSYCDGTGWHLRDITTGNAPNWCPPAGTPAVNWLIPITMSDGSLWVVERTEVLRVREGFRNQAYVIESAPIGFNPDALAFSSGVMRVGYCTDEGESVSSATIVDLTLQSGAQSIGVVSGGAIMFSAGPDLDYTTVEIGPNESTGGVDAMNPPFPSQMLDKQSRVPVPSPWAGFFSGLGNRVTTLERRPIPVPTAQAAGFGVIDPDTVGEVAIAATQPDDTLTLASSDGSITFATNPFTKTLDLRAGATVAFHVQHTLDNDDIKALPTTAFDLVPAQGANTIVLLIQAFARADFSAGAYTNVDPDNAYLYVANENEEIWSSAIINRSSVPVTWLDQFLAATDQNVTFLPFNDTDPILGLTPFVPGSGWSASVNVPLQLIAFNNGAGNWTGGNAANSLVIDVFYAVVGV